MFSFEDISNRTLLIIIILICLTILLVHIIDKASEKGIIAEAAQSGLQQCIVEHQVIWSKECPK